MRPIVKSSAPSSQSVDFTALQRHGFKGGPSVLLVPQAAADVSVDWSQWGTKERQGGGERGKGVTEEDDDEQEQKRRRREREESERLQALASSSTVEVSLLCECCVSATVVMQSDFCY